MKAKQEKQLVKQFALQLTEEKAKQKEVSKIYSNKKKIMKHYGDSGLWYVRFFFNRKRESGEKTT